jgi:hypothetical protein
MGEGLGSRNEKTLKFALGVMIMSFYETRVGYEPS